MRPLSPLRRQVPAGAGSNQLPRADRYSRLAPGRSRPLVFRRCLRPTPFAILGRPSAQASRRRAEESRASRRAILYSEQRAYSPLSTASRVAVGPWTVTSEHVTSLTVASHAPTETLSLNISRPLWWSRVPVVPVAVVSPAQPRSGARGPALERNCLTSFMCTRP